jgi:phosphatidylserine decarboxylase
MTLRSLLSSLSQQENLNFLLTNRIPRHLATRLIGWFSKIERPLVRDLSIGVWRLFSDLDLSEAKTSHFKSMHDCFTRQLRDGARPVDPDPGVLTSPCDAIVGACGRITGTEVLQVKGSPYPLRELLGGPDPDDGLNDGLDEVYRDGQYATLRLRSSMYHRFHAPHDCRIEEVTYISGDTWNVNPIALKRVERLFCKNERAVIRARLAATGYPIALVPVAAVLVASMRFHFLDVPLNLKYRGPNVIPCDVAYRKGEELGWFEHGSTIIVLAPAGFSLCVGEGALVRMGQPLMRLP